MEVIMWHKQRILFFILISVVLFFLMKNRTGKIYRETILPNTNAEKVWEFMADFSHTKKVLVPHIEDFVIMEETGNYDSWRYTVKYNEPLPVWPYLNGVAVGHYSIKEDGRNKYVISSETNMCFISRWTCSKSVADFQISQMNKDTLYTETVYYDCPLILNGVCNYFAKLTREMFVENLKDYYKTNPHH